MIHLGYCVFDRKAGIYNRPFFDVADGAAVRAFQDQVQNGRDSLLNRYPEDFDLVKVGAFDDALGSFSFEKLVVLANGGQFKEKSDAQAVLPLR